MRQNRTAVIVALVAGAVTAAFAACTARETAKDAYTAQSHACLVAFTTRADQEDCLKRVRARWDEAGAPPAAVDAGGQ